VSTKRVVWSAVVGCLVWLGGAAGWAAQATLEEAVAQIGEKAATVKSYEADMTMSISMMGQAMTTKGHMIYRTPDCTHVEMEMDMGVMKMKQLMVSDGKWMWMHQPAMNMITKIDMTKLNAQAKGSLGGAASGGTSDLTKALDMFDKETLKLLRTEDLDGVRTFVFEGAMPKAAQGGQPMQMPFMPEKVQVWIAATDGVMRKTVMLDKDGKEAMSQTYTNVVLNKEYPDSQFQFTPPPGAQVMDMTEGALNMVKSATGGAPAAPPAPAKAP
jgi:outer membrane lipoprotein-sorting protein